MSSLLLFASTFISVFALGLQSLNVNQGHYLAAGITSVLISTGHIFLYRFMPDANVLDALGYYAGGIAGITASMWVHPRLKAWWARRRDEHANVELCGLQGRDDIH